jgi:hypothetical protein
MTAQIAETSGLTIAHWGRGGVRESPIDGWLAGHRGSFVQPPLRAKQHSLAG